MEKVTRIFLSAVDPVLEEVVCTWRRAERARRVREGEPIGPENFSKLVVYNGDGGLTVAKQLLLGRWVIFRSNDDSDTFVRNDRGGVFWGLGEMHKKMWEEYCEGSYRPTYIRYDNVPGGGALEARFDVRERRVAFNDIQNFPFSSNLSPLVPAPAPES